MPKWTDEQFDAIRKRLRITHNTSTPSEETHMANKNLNLVVPEHEQLFVELLEQKQNLVYLNKWWTQRIAARDLFFELTRYTAPAHKEHEVPTYQLLRELLAPHLTEDKHGNLYFERLKPDGTRSDTLFCCHMDSVCHKIEPNILKWDRVGVVTTHGNTVMGADDRAGMAILLYLIIHRVPGRYYFFVAEEVGRHGSEAVAKNWREIRARQSMYDKLSDENKAKTFRDKNHILEGVKRAICWDRTGMEDVITHQSSERCASAKFASALCTAWNALNFGDGVHKYKPCDGGSFTDTYSFMRGLIPECTNLAIGYRLAHTQGETQDLNFLDGVALRAIAMDWEALPTDRDPDVVERRGSKYEGNYVRYVEKMFGDEGYNTYSSVYSEELLGRFFRNVIVLMEQRDETWEQTAERKKVEDAEWKENSTLMHEIIRAGFDTKYINDFLKVWYPYVMERSILGWKLTTHDVLRFIYRYVKPEVYHTGKKGWEWYQPYRTFYHLPDTHITPTVYKTLDSSRGYVRVYMRKYPGEWGLRREFFLNSFNLMSRLQYIRADDGKTHMEQSYLYIPFDDTAPTARHVERYDFRPYEELAELHKDDRNFSIAVNRLKNYLKDNGEQVIVENTRDLFLSIIDWADDDDEDDQTGVIRPYA